MPRAHYKIFVQPGVFWRYSIVDLWHSSLEEIARICKYLENTINAVSNYSFVRATAYYTNPCGVKKPGQPMTAITADRRKKMYWLKVENDLSVLSGLCSTCSWEHRFRSKYAHIPWRGTSHNWASLFLRTMEQPQMRLLSKYSYWQLIALDAYCTFFIILFGKSAVHLIIIISAPRIMICSFPIWHNFILLHDWHK